MKAFITASLLIYSCAIAQQRQQQQRAPLPPFLVGASQQVINEFQQLLSTAGQRTDSQMEQAIESWIARQSQQIQVSNYLQYKLISSIYQ